MLWCGYANLRKNVQRLVFTVFGDEPSWAFWQEPDAAELDDWHCGLNGDGYPPCCVGCVFSCSKDCPRCYDCAHVPKRVVHCRQLASMRWMGEFEDKQGCRAL